MKMKPFNQLTDREKMDFAHLHIKQFPHCDQRVLHAPGECQYCDKHADWQALRIATGIAFTGHEPNVERKELPCPAWFARGENCQKWGGNTPKPLRPKDTPITKFVEVSTSLLATLGEWTEPLQVRVASEVDAILEMQFRKPI